MRLVPALVVIAMCALGCKPGVDQKEASSVVGHLGATIDDYLTSQVEGGFSGAVLVAKNGEIVLRRGYGYADRETEINNTPETVFQIGSVTKPFTATSILKLVDQSQLKTGDRITKFFDGVPADKSNITVHQLLTHTSGLPPAIGDDYAAIGRSEYIANALSTPLDREPGSGYEYSNVGYALLAAIVELTTNRSYDHFVREELLGPAGINNTGYLLPNAMPYAHGYDGSEDLGLPFDRPWDDSGPYWNLRGNGGLLSTVDDLYKFHKSLEAGELISKDLLAVAYEQHTDEGNNSRSHYGYGWAIFQTARGTRLIAHNGGDPGFAADVLRYLDDDVFLAVVSNDDEAPAYEISSRLAEIVFGGSPKSFQRAAFETLAINELDGTVGGQRALAFVEAVNAANDSAYRDYVQQHMDAGFKQDEAGVVRFFGAIQQEVGGLPISLQQARWDPQESTFILFAQLASGAWYQIDLGVQPGGKYLVEGLQTDLIDGPPTE